MIIV
ncbi:hypothetical protein VCHC41A1_0007, partial [Vibrio cholerae HC-41A1]|jgi:hypothetical protein